MAYATTADLAQRVPAAALAPVSIVVQEKALADASSEADTYLRAQHPLPLVAPYDPALVRHVCWLAMWSIMSYRGLNVEAGSNTLFSDNQKAAIRWLTAVSRGEVSLALTADSASPPRPGGARVSTQPRRGWQR